jgi:hypothetical protein
MGSAFISVSGIVSHNWGSMSLLCDSALSEIFSEPVWAAAIFVH